jgi:hypothetical protein
LAEDSEADESVILVPEADDSVVDVLGSLLTFNRQQALLFLAFKPNISTGTGMVIVPVFDTVV